MTAGAIATLHLTHERMHARDEFISSFIEQFRKTILIERDKDGKILSRAKLYQGLGEILILGTFEFEQLTKIIVAQNCFH